MSKQLIRFAFTINAEAAGETPTYGLALSGWRVGVTGEDTYITAKAVGGIWKASLHADVAWRLAMTREHFESRKPPLPPNPADRATWKFAPTPFVNGVRLAFVVAASRGSLRPARLDWREQQVAVDDRWDQLTRADVWMTEAGADVGLAGHSRLVGGPLRLSSGRQVWVTAASEPVEPEDPQPIPAGVMLKPLSPEKDGVSAPGLMAVGLHVR